VRCIAGKRPIKSLKDAAQQDPVLCLQQHQGRHGKKEGQPITVLSEAVIVPPGVVWLTELQEKGWSYVRP
jgi:uncharacterized protein